MRQLSSFSSGSNFRCAEANVERVAQVVFLAARPIADFGRRQRLFRFSAAGCRSFGVKASFDEGKMLDQQRRFALHQRLIEPRRLAHLPQSRQRIHGSRKLALVEILPGQRLNVEHGEAAEHVGEFRVGHDHDVERREDVRPALRADDTRRRPPAARG